MNLDELLSSLNVLLVGVWVGMYLFTTLVVSPAFVELFPDAELRIGHRRRVGRHYVRVNTPVTLAILLTVLALGATRGFGVLVWLELATLALIGGLVGIHVRQGGHIRPPTWLTQTTLAASGALCLLTLMERG